MVKTISTNIFRLANIDANNYIIEKHYGSKDKKIFINEFPII